MRVIKMTDTRHACEILPEYPLRKLSLIDREVDEGIVLVWIVSYDVDGTGSASRPMLMSILGVLGLRLLLA
jgi:hypothetical protein